MPSVLGAVSQLYRDLRDAIAALPTLAAIAFVFLVVTDVVQSTIITDQRPMPTRDLLVLFVIQCARGFLLTPYLIAVHRLIILGEIASSYTFRPQELRFQTFLGWMLALQVVSMLPSFLLHWAPQSEVRTSTMIGISLVVAIALLRLSLVFPAAAVDSPGATFSSAINDTKGHVWRMIFVVTLASLALLIPVTLLAYLLRIDGVLTLTPKGIGTALLSSALGLAILTLMVAFASRFYLWIGKHTKGAPAPAD